MQYRCVTSRGKSIENHTWCMLGNGGMPHDRGSTKFGDFTFTRTFWLLFLGYTKRERELGEELGANFQRQLLKYRWCSFVFFPLPIFWNEGFLKLVTPNAPIPCLHARLSRAFNSFPCGDKLASRPDGLVRCEKTTRACLSAGEGSTHSFGLLWRWCHVLNKCSKTTPRVPRLIQSKIIS